MKYYLIEINYFQRLQLVAWYLVQFGDDRWGENKLSVTRNLIHEKNLKMIRKKVAPLLQKGT